MDVPQGYQLKRKRGRPRKEHPHPLTLLTREFFAKNPHKVQEYAENRRRKIAADPETRVGYLVSAAKSRAKEEGAEFDVETADFLPETELCRLSGDKLGWNNTSLQPNSPTIDRIDPTKGYTRQNTIIITHRANRIKNDATPEELEKIARNLRELKIERGLL